MRLLFFTACIALGLLANGQSKKAFKYYKEARTDMAKGNDDDALKNARKAVEESPEYVEARMLSAQLLTEKNQLAEALELYEGALKYNPPFYFYYVYGNALYQAEEYARAEQIFKTYIENPNATPEYREKASVLRNSAIFAVGAVQNPQPFTPENLGSLVNTDQLDYFPSISANGNVMVFTHRSLKGAKKDEDFWVTTRDSLEAPWRQSQPLRGYLNTDYNEGAQSISANGKVIFFASCDRPGGKGSCDIYASFYKGKGIWGTPVNLGDAVNTPAWESQPSISSDGKTLYFVRGGSSVAKNVDIYSSTLNGEGRWSKAKPLSAIINTPLQESSPFIHYDNEHLYFSSEGHPGMGDKDFFVSERQPDGTWGTPRNLGYPINTSGEEFGLIVGPNGKTGYYSSDKGEVNYGLVDLYSFELPEELRAQEIAYIEGNVRNKETKEPLEAHIDFTSLSTAGGKYVDSSNRVGYYSRVLPTDADYALSIQKPGYLFFSKNFSLYSTSKKRVFTVNVDLIPIAVGSKVKLENVFFATDSYQLDGRSTAELNELVAFLNSNPSVNISIEGHTDNQGEPGYNKRLSKNRANSVQEYLVEKGIDPGRLSTKGFGDSQPVATNETEKGRRLNRRTEVKITAE